MWCSPTACVGEFDSLEGPRLKYAYEYFDYRRSGDCRDVTQMVAFVGGNMLVGKSIASGHIHPNYETYMRTVASRALVSNDSREESVIFQEPGGPVVGSVCFSLSDILARGEKRRFCLVFMHPSLSHLVARWSLLSAFSRMFIDDATARASRRQDREYELFADLERRRDEARRKPLRSLMELLADEHETEQDAVIRLHCCFEVCLPVIFSSPVALALPATGQDDAAALTHAFRCTMNEQLPFAQLYVESIDVDEDVPIGTALVPEYAKNVLFPEEEIIVKPLAVWLTDLFSADNAESVLHLLDALFSGNQILVSSTDPMDGVNFTLSLAHTLPPSLARWRVLSEEYVMPYAAQIVSFGERFLCSHEIGCRNSARAPNNASQTTPPPSATKERLMLEDLGDHVTHVSIQGGRIWDVMWSGDGADSGHSTIASRCGALVENTCATAPGRSPPVAALKGLTAQLDQLVAEYVVRGGVYTALFRKQEIEANRGALGVPTSPRRATSATGGTLVGQFLSLLRGGNTDPLRRATTSSQARPAHLDKHATLCKQAGVPFNKERFVFSSFSETDHATLLFLGQASVIAVSR